MSYVNKSKKNKFGAKGVAIDETKALEQFDGYAVDIDDPAGGTVLEARAGKDLNETLPETAPDGSVIEWDPDFILSPVDGTKWYVKERNLTIGNLTCTNCGSGADKKGVIAHDDVEDKLYAVAQCGNCKGYLFAELTPKG